MTPFNTYRKTEILTASPEKVLLLLYEGAIRFNKLALQAIDTENSTDRAKYIGRTQEIINELNASLKKEMDQELYTHLVSLYHYITEKLVLANQTGEKTPLIEVTKILETLYSGWEQAIRQLKTATQK